MLPWPLQHLGGVNQVVLNLARAMQARGSYKPVVLVSDWACAQPVWGEVEGVAVVCWRLRGPAAGASHKVRLATWWWARRFGPAFARFCQQHAVATINPHYPTEATLLLEPLARAHGVQAPLVVSFHGADLTGLQATPPHTQRAWNELLRRAGAVVACSAALADRVAGSFGVAPTVVHNGIDAAAFVRMAGPRQPQAGGRRTILSVGKFEHKKGQDVLLEAFASLAARHANVDLLLVGATDAALEPLRRRCAELGLNARVAFKPDTPHPEVARLFAAAHLFALPSRQEPFGIVLLEAGCLALPVVATRVGGIPEILEDGVTARLVPPDDAPAMAAALEAMLVDPAAAQAMGERLQSHVNRSFSWARALDGYVAASARRTR